MRYQLSGIGRSKTIVPRLFQQVNLLPEIHENAAISEVSGENAKASQVIRDGRDVGGTASVEAMSPEVVE